MENQSYVESVKRTSIVQSFCPGLWVDVFLDFYQRG